MISAIIASHCVFGSIQTERLQLKVFSDFATELTQDSGYRLEIPPEIASRPVVFYFGNPGDGTSDLLRACQDLDLGCFLDKDKSKILVTGHSAIAQPVHRERVLNALSTTLPTVKELMGQSISKLEKEYSSLFEAFENETLNPQDREVIAQRMSLLGDLLSAEDRLVHAQMLQMNQSALANQLASAHYSVQVPLGREALSMWNQIVRDGITPAYSEDRINNADPESQADMRDSNSERQKRFQSYLDNDADLVLLLDTDDYGNILARLRLVSDTDVWAISVVSYPTKMRPKIVPGKVTHEQVFQKFEEVLSDPKRQLIPEQVTMNSLTEEAFATKGNTVSWLINPYYPVFFRPEEFVKPILFEQSADGWWKVQDQNLRYSRYVGDWRLAIEITEILRTKKNIYEKLEPWLLTHVPLDLDNAWRALDSKNFRYENTSWMKYGGLVMAAVQEFKATGKTEFSKTLNELSPEAQKMAFGFFNSDLVHQNFTMVHRRANRPLWGGFKFEAKLGDSSLSFKCTAELGPRAIYGFEGNVNRQ